MKKIIHSIFIFLLSTTLVLADAAILPNAKTTFVDSNGKPLTSGTVDFYVPGTTTRKTTWQDSGETTPNTNPVVLDAAGRALIWGDGAYRQVVKDRNGNVIWDQVTSSAGSSGSGGSTVGDGDAVGTVKPWSGFVAPSQYEFAYGQAKSRTSFSALYSAITLNTTVTCVGGSATLTNISDTSQLAVGATIESICVLGNPTIISKTSNTVTLSSNAVISVTTTARFFPYGNGDGLTTFNVPDLRGYALVGRSNMGGVTSSVLTDVYFHGVGNGPDALYAVGGNQSTTLLAANLPPHTHTSSTLTDPGHTHVISTQGVAGSVIPGGVGVSSNDTSVASAVTNSNTTGITISANTGVNASGISTPISRVMPAVTTNYIIKVTPDSASSSFNGVQSIGGMSGVITCGVTLNCSGNNIDAIIPTQTIQTVGTVASLRALSAGAYSTVLAQGYYASNDGGGGTFNWNGSSSCVDDGGTCIQPNSLPANGRWVRQYNGQNINVKWFGVKGDGTSESMTQVNAARDAAIAIKGGLYFPSTANYYNLPSALIIPDNTHGLHIFGDANGTPVAATASGTSIITTAATAIDMTGVALGGTGSISHIIIEQLQVAATGVSGKAIKAWNVDNFIMRQVTADATQGNALDMAGTAHFNFTNVYLYAAGGSPFFASQSAVGSQNIGPGSYIGGQLSITSDAFPVLSITGDPLGVSFINTDFYWQNMTNASAIELNATSVSSFTQTGVLSFINCHAESTYNTTNTGTTIRVGNTTKWGTLKIEGGNFWGPGNGTNYQRDGVQIVTARSVIINGTTFSKLSSTNGFSRAAIRLEAGFPASGDFYNFEGIVADNVSGAQYSDVNGRCSGTGNCTFGSSTGNIFNAINLTNTTAHGLLVGQGASANVISTAAMTNGQLLVGQTGADPLPKTVSGDCTFTAAGALTCTKTNGATFGALATIAPGTGVATALGNAVNTAGGVPTQPVANASLANSATTVAGQTCTLGSTCGLSSLTNSLGSDVALNNTANYFDGPSVAQGTTGTWYASGTVTLKDTAGSALIDCKLWDGTSVMSSIAINTNAASDTKPAPLSGVITTPAGNIRISCKDLSSTSGVMQFNNSGNSKDSTISAFRIN